MAFWDVIPKITTITALAAFAVACAFVLARIALQRRASLIRLAPENDRATLVEKEIADLRISAEGLTKAQQYQLVMKVLDARSGRFRVGALVVLAICGMASVILVVWLLHRSRPLAGTSGTDTGSTTRPAAAPVVTPPTAEQNTADLSSLRYVLQSLDQKMQSRNSLVGSLRRYASSKSADDWARVKSDLDATDHDSTQLQEARSKDLGRFVVAKHALFLELLDVLQQKIQLSKELHAMPFPHDAAAIARLDAIATSYEKLTARAGDVSQQLLIYLQDQHP